MQTNDFNPSNFKSKVFDFENTSSKINVSEVFADRQNNYLNEFTLFVAYFNTIPNFVGEVNINCRKANQWFANKYNAEINDIYYDKLYKNLQDKNAEFDDIFYFLYEDLIVNFDTSNSRVRFLFRKTELAKVENLAKEIHKYRNKKEKRKPTISLLVKTSNGIEIKDIAITKPKLSIHENYNDNFKDICQIIIKRLSKKNEKGIVLLHGKPGTGKTSYIRYLIASLKKNVIFLTPNMASAITNPDLIPILIHNPNSIFVIEDAENIIVDRDKNGSSPVSALLNVSDGLLSDCLNIQIICSFNTDISRIDSALMRKGRLIAKYEFKELATEKAQFLSNKLGFKSRINSPMTLAEIYNQNESDFQQKKIRNPIGFNIINSN